MFDTLVNKAEKEYLMQHHLELTHTMNSHFKSKSMVGLIRSSISEESDHAVEGDTSMEGHEQLA